MCRPFDLLAVWSLPLLSDGGLCVWQRLKSLDWPAGQTNPALIFFTFPILLSLCVVNRDSPHPFLFKRPDLECCFVCCWDGCWDGYSVINHQCQSFWRFLLGVRQVSRKKQHVGAWFTCEGFIKETSMNWRIQRGSGPGLELWGVSVLSERCDDKRGPFKGLFYQAHSVFLWQGEQNT